mmetsp:Transcript_82454/g.238140  ORF Transcript_82454/g.238140 Transcript_82454/m.238140 type:complete len:224 (+) Transcript_82454:724-1395(+)
MVLVFPGRRTAASCRSETGASPRASPTVAGASDSSPPCPTCCVDACWTVDCSAKRRSKGLTASRRRTCVGHTSRTVVPRGAAEPAQPPPPSVWTASAAPLRVRSHAAAPAGSCSNAASPPSLSRSWSPPPRLGHSSTASAPLFLRNMVTSAGCMVAPDSPPLRTTSSASSLARPCAAAPAGSCSCVASPLSLLQPWSAPLRLGHSRTASVPSMVLLPRRWTSS